MLKILAPILICLFFLPLMGLALAQSNSGLLSTPTDLTATAASSSEIDLTWSPSDFSEGGYNIYRQGEKIGETSVTSYNDTLLSPSTSYSYQVTAWGKKGGHSGRSNVASATTQAGPVKTGSGGSWNLTFSDEFNGTSLDQAMWNTRLTWGYSEGGSKTLNGYAPDDVSESNGQLHLTIEKRTMKLGKKYYHYTSGMIQNAGHFFQAYGYFEMRARFPVGTGFWPGFWLLPDPTANGPGPSQSEIDAIELMKPMDSTSPFGVYHLHWGYGKEAQGGPGIDKPDFGDGNFHVIAIDWEPGIITWYVDGDATYQIVSSNVPNLPMYLIVNLDLGNANWTGRPDESTPFPSTMDIDYIRVYTKASSGGCYKSTPQPTDPIPSINCSSVSSL